LLDLHPFFMSAQHAPPKLGAPKMGSLRDDDSGADRRGEASIKESLQRLVASRNRSCPEPSPGSRLTSAAAGVLLAVLASCSESQANSSAGAEAESDWVGSIVDEPVAPFRTEWLETAFQVASAIPIEPHVKTRSLVQVEVVSACLELEQPRRALGYIERIDNWRRGEGYADLAFHLARHGNTRAVLPLLDLALQVAETAKDANSQSWRKDRIRAKVARTHLWSGRTEPAAQLSAGLEASEVGLVEAVRARVTPQEDFDEGIDAIDGIVATGSLDQARVALEACAALFDRYYEDVDRRSIVEATFEAASERVPVQVRIELGLQLAGVALEHQDAGKALALVEAVKRVLDGSNWRTEDRIPVLARLAELRHRAGEREQARSEVDGALALYDAHRDEIVDIYRAGALRPLAEAYCALDDPATGRALYSRALEEGVQNPNSIPRAEDLSATCRSLARRGIEPDALLRDRIQQIVSGLGEPW
jgi:hypothetical protein